jgi:hypothetical protein
VTAIRAASKLMGDGGRMAASARNAERLNNSR